MTSTATTAARPTSARPRLPRLLVGTFGVVLVTDVVGGLLDVAAGRSDLASVWGSGATLCAPAPMVALQALTTALALTAGRRTPRVAAALLGAACLVSVVSGFVDGQLARSDLARGEVAFQVWLLAATAALGVLGLVRAGTTRHPRTGGPTY